MSITEDSTRPSCTADEIDNNFLEVQIAIIFSSCLPCYNRDEAAREENPHLSAGRDLERGNGINGKNCQSGMSSFPSPADLPVS